VTLVDGTWIEPAPLCKGAHPPNHVISGRLPLMGQWAIRALAAKPAGRLVPTVAEEAAAATGRKWRLHRGKLRLTELLKLGQLVVHAGGGGREVGLGRLRGC
jgi:hypothetical protein